jgi:hypothetical protein
MRISRVYGIDEADLRAGWNKPQAIVDEIASQDPVTAAKVQNSCVRHATSRPTNGTP